jgi:hypothetical protein
MHMSLLGNASLTIKGNNLGSSYHVPYVTVGGMPCLKVIPVSSEEVVCKTPPGSAGNHPVGVSVSGRTTEACLCSDRCNDRVKRCVTYHRPEVHSIRPRHGSIVGGTELSIKGVYFGQVSSKLHLNVGDFECREATWVSSTSMRCVTSIGKRGIFRVAFAPITKCFDRMSKCNTAEPPVATANAGVIDFVYDAPLIHSISPSHGPTSGNTIITLSGEFFTKDAIVVVGGAPCNGVVMHDNETITCGVPPGLVGETHVTVSAGPGFQPYPCHSCAKYLYEGLQVVAISPSAGPFYGGQRVLLTANNFAKDLHVYFGSSECLNLRNTSDTQIECIAPRGLPGIVDVSLSSAGPLVGHNIKTSLKYEYQVPTVNSVTPFTGSICGGTVVTVRGTHFGTDSGTKVTVAIGELDCPEVKRISEEEIQCKVDESFFASTGCATSSPPRRSL